MVLMALIVAPMMELMALNVVKYYNEYELKKASKEKREPVLIHQFSSHVMRHTGCTNMARSGVNIKAAQYIMGHAKSDVTLDVYNHLNNAFDAKLEIKKLEKNGTVNAKINLIKPENPVKSRVLKITLKKLALKG